MLAYSLLNATLHSWCWSPLALVYLLLLSCSELLLRNHVMEEQYWENILSRSHFLFRRFGSCSFALTHSHPFYNIWSVCVGERFLFIPTSSHKRMKYGSFTLFASSLVCLCICQLRRRRRRRQFNPQTKKRVKWNRRRGITSIDWLLFFPLVCVSCRVSPALKNL